MRAVQDTPDYTSKIIKAGALIPDTQILLTHWKIEASTQENLDQFQQENLFGKASRSRIADILTIFRSRYLSSPDITAALVTLASHDWSALDLRPILYFLSAQADPLLRDVVIQVLLPKVGQHRLDIRTDEVQIWLRAQVAAGRTAQPWSEKTSLRIAQGLLATLRDFGVLDGQMKKRIRIPTLTPAAFAFIAFILRGQHRSGEKLLHDPAWQLFFLHPQDVERLFIEAHQEGLLTYQAAGNVIRIDFPARTVRDYAHTLAQRAL